jgi:hypothetical protein
MGKIYGLSDLRIGKVGKLVFRKVENKNIVSEKPKYYPVNSAWLTREEFKQYVLSLLDVGIPQIYALSELPEDLYDYALIFLQTDEKCLVYLDKDGTRTQIRLEGGASDYDAVDVVDNLPQNPRNNTIYIKNNGDTLNDTPTYTMYVCENDTLTKIDFGNKTITTSPPLEIDDNDNISLKYNASHFILKNDQLSAEPIVNLIDNKQDKLVSGINIRTIGGNSLVNTSLMRQDIEPSDIMSLEKPLKWDINDSYRVKIGFNSNDFELDSDDNLKIKSSAYPVVGAVSPLFLDNNKKVNIGIVNGNGLQVANNKLQMSVSAPLFQSTGNKLNFRYSTTDFSVTSNTFNATPLKTAIATDMTTLSNAINTLDSAAVKKTGNQTISGTKTFTGSLVGTFSGNSAFAVNAAEVTGCNFKTTGYSLRDNRWLMSLNVTDKNGTLCGRLVFESPGNGSTKLMVMLKNIYGNDVCYTLASG